MCGYGGGGCMGGKGIRQGEGKKMGMKDPETRNVAVNEVKTITKSIRTYRGCKY
jgi:hypothetical protein